ncbi:hypothetical protein AADU81_001060 [Vibrio alginolyticus]
MYEKIVYIILGAAIGKIFDCYIQRRKVSSLKKAILEELEDIKYRLLLICRAYERNIQIYALNGIDSGIPLKLSNPIFKKHYSDIAIKLGSSQRKSLSLIDSCVESVNSGINQIEELHAYTVENLSDEAMKRWGNLLKAQYINAATAYWHVNYHLSNKELPFLEIEDSEEHKAYLSQRKSSEAHVEKLINRARESLKRDDFI